MSPASSIAGIVCVVDDEAAVRQALSSLIRSVGLPVETYATAREFLDRDAPGSPGCLILDVNLGGKNGLILQQELREAGVLVPIVFITGHGDVPMSVQAMKAGAVDFLTKPFRDRDVLHAIHEAINRDRAARMREDKRAGLRQRYDLLTAREREVMARVVKGLLNKEIAAEWGTAEITVKIQRGQVMRKMKARSVPDLVRMAGILAEGPDDGHKTKV